MRKLANGVRAAQVAVVREAGKISRLANLKISKCGGLEYSEGNGIFQKETKESFGEKKL